MRLTPVLAPNLRGSPLAKCHWRPIPCQQKHPNEMLNVRTTPLGPLTERPMVGLEDRQGSELEFRLLHIMRIA